MFIQQKSKTQGPQGECNGVPIPKGYPDARSAARRGGPIHLVSKSSSVGQKSWCRRMFILFRKRWWLCLLILFLSLFFFCMVGLFILGALEMNDPYFKIKSILVSLEHNNLKSDDSQVTATWNIGFSVDNSNLLSPFVYQGFNVWILCMYPTSSVMIPPPFIHSPGNTTFLNATVNTVLPDHDLPAWIRQLEFDVILRAKYKVSFSSFIMEAVCKGMRVGFSRSSEKGISVRGPRSCSHIRQRIR